MKYSRKEIYNSQNHITLQKVKNMKHFDKWIGDLDKV